MADNQMMSELDPYIATPGLEYPRGSYEYQGGPYIPERARSDVLTKLGIEPHMRELSTRDMTLPASWIEAAGMPASQNKGNTLLGNFGRQALTLVPGLSPGMDAYDAFQDGRYVRGGLKSAQAAAEVALPFVVGKMVAGTTPGNWRGGDGYGVRAGDTFGANLATLNIGGINTPAKFGIRPDARIMDDALGVSLASRRAAATDGGAMRDYMTSGYAIRSQTPEQMAAMRAATSVPRDPEAAVSLSVNGYPNKSGLFAYGIFKNGKQIGTARGHVNGEDAHISWIGDNNIERGANTIGVSGVRALREAIRADFPNAKVFSGNRISGSKGSNVDAENNVTRGPATREGVSNKQRVRIPAWMMGAGLAGGMYAGDENQMLRDEAAQ